MSSQGENLRSTASHTLNSNSSRSHVVFTVHLEIRSGADEKVMYCKINFVDLAGSERTKKSGVAGQTLKEAMYINRSLSFLEQTVNSLSRKEAHVPFRQTKLTAVLRDALGGNCKTVSACWNAERVATDCTWVAKVESKASKGRQGRVSAFAIENRLVGAVNCCCSQRTKT